MNFDLSKIDIPSLLEPSHLLGALLLGIFVVIAATLASRVIRMTSNRVLRRTENELVDPTVVLFLTQFAQIAAYIVALIIYFHLVPALNKLGTALLTGVSVMSVVFGLAAQNTLSNLVAGCTLLLYRPFHIDDLIQVATPTGTEVGIVERLTLGYTMLRTLDDRLVIVPNSLMASQVSLNLNRRNLHMMMVLPITVRDNTKLKEVRETLMDLAHKNELIYKVVPTHLQRLEDGDVIVTLRGWCANDQDAKRAQAEITQAMMEKFGSGHEILMPTPPQIDDLQKEG
jgi:small-conductance mechanosensitive channel